MTDDPRTNPRIRKWSLLLSSLALTPDAGMESFRERRAADAKLDVTKLKQARAILDALAQAIESTDAGRWQRIVLAFDLLEKDARITDEAPPVAGPSAPPRAAAAPVVKPSAPSADPMAKPSAAPVAKPSAPAIDPMAKPSAPTPAPAPIIPAPVVAPSPAPVAFPPPPPSVAPSPSPGWSSSPSPWAAAAPASVPSPAPVAAPPPVAASAPLAMTTIAAGSPLYVEYSLPFRNQAGPAPQAIAPVGPQKQSGKTAEARPLSDAQLSAATEATGAPTFTVEQYASLSVERELNPERGAEVRARYGLADERAEKQLDEAWQLRVLHDPKLRAELAKKIREFRAWLVSRR